MPIENPSVREYLLKRKAERDALEEQNQGFDTGGVVAGGLASLASAFQGGDSMSAASKVMNDRSVARNKSMASFDAGTDRYLKDQEVSRAADIADVESDPNSLESKMANELASSMGYKGPQITATQFKSFSPVMQKKYEIEQQKLNRQEARDERRFQAGMKMDERRYDKDLKMDEKRQGRLTPFGEANTEDDAKKLKEGYESKQNFDSKIQEMIALREKHGGGAMMNRDDVARGKQLSKDLLLEYKNLAKLGVLSAADEAIINQIIPEDPLQYNSPLASIQGQDPTLHRLKKFKGDSDKDFQTRIQTRTRDGIAKTPQSGKTVVKTQTNKTTGEQRIVYSDGSFEIVGNKTAGR